MQRSIAWVRVSRTMRQRHLQATANSDLVFVFISCLEWHERDSVEEIDNAAKYCLTSFREYFIRYYRFAQRKFLNIRVIRF